MVIHTGIISIKDILLYCKIYYKIILIFRLYGSYEALNGGTTCEAMEDFTGGVTEMYELFPKEKIPPNLFQIMMKAYERSSLLGCSIEPDPNVLEAQTPEGLIKGHAYSITRIKYFDIQTPRISGKILLIRVRNPWGNVAEWNGPFSDKYVILIISYFS